MLLSPAIWIVAVLYLVTTCTCDSVNHHHLSTSRWKAKHHHNNHHNYSDPSNYLGRTYGSARRQYLEPSTVSPWARVVKKSFGPFTTTTTTTTRPPTSVHSASHRMSVRLVSDDVKLRHKSRFPHLDSVIDRLDKYAVSTQRPKPLKNELDSMDGDDDNEEDIFDDDDLNMDDDYLLDAEDTNNLDDDTDYLEDDTADDEEDIEDEDDDERTSRGGRNYDSSSSWVGSQQNTHQQGGNMNTVPDTNSPFTAYKWKMYGTKQRVDETRRVHLEQQQQHKSAQTSQSAINAAVFQHIVRMNTESRCKLPLPRLVNVKLEHPSVGIAYIPHCTLLHRCSDDTGCCVNHNMRCAPKTQTQVQLYFYTSTSSGTGNRVVKLPFYNHTECACLPKHSTNPATIDEVGSMIEPKSARIQNRSIQPAPVSIKRCSCPEEYVPSILRESESRCICDCEDTNSDCQRMKKGKEYFSLKDRICINTSKCGGPVCEYGGYLKDTGRCPKPQENIYASAQIYVNRN